MIARLKQFVGEKAGEQGSVRRRYVSAVVWNLLASVGSRSVNMLTTIGCARFLGKTGFGQFGIVQNTANMVGILAALGLGVTATRYVADLRHRDPERAGRIIGLSWTIAVFSGFSLTVLSFLTAPLIAERLLHAPELANSLRIASLLVLLQSMLAFQNGALAGLEAFRRIARINLIASGVGVPLIFVGVWKWGVNGALVGTTISLALNWFMNERLLKKECRQAGIPIRIREGFQEGNVFWTFSLPALMGSLITAPVLWFLGVLVVRSPHGFEQMALYSGADRWRLAILFIPTALFQSALPMLSNMHKENPEGYKRVAKANLWVNMAVVLAPVLVIAGFSKLIMSTYGAGFKSGWPVLALFCIGTLPEALNTILGYPLIAQGKMWQRCGFDVLLALLLLLSALWLVPAHGAFGLAWAYLIAYTLTSTGLYIATRTQTVVLPDGPVAMH